MTRGEIVAWRESHSSVPLARRGAGLQGVVRSRGISPSRSAIGGGEIGFADFPPVDRETRLPLVPESSVKNSGRNRPESYAPALVELYGMRFTAIT